MLIIEEQCSGLRMHRQNSEIDDICRLLASDNPSHPTDKERRRADVYRDRIMKQGRAIQAAGVTVWLDK